MEKPENLDEIKKVWIYTCRCGYTLFEHVLYEEDENDRSRPWEERCGCDCDDCGLKSVTSQSPVKFYRDPPNNAPGIVGGKLLPKEERGWSPFLNKYLMTTGDVREYDKNHPNMEYAYGEDLDNHRSEWQKKEWERIKKKRRKKKEKKNEQNS